MAGKPKKFGPFCLPCLPLENRVVGLPVRGLAIRGLAPWPQEWTIGPGLDSQSFLVHTSIPTSSAMTVGSRMSM